MFTCATKVQPVSPTLTQSASGHLHLALLRYVADLWRGMPALSLPVQMSEHQTVAVSFWVALCIMGSNRLTRWSSWQWNLGDWMEQFAGTLHTTFCIFTITYENGSGSILLIIKGKHTSFPWEILRLGYNSPPTMGEAVKTWDPAT